MVKFAAKYTIYFEKKDFSKARYYALLANKQLALKRDKNNNLFFNGTVEEAFSILSNVGRVLKAEAKQPNELKAAYLHYKDAMQLFEQLQLMYESDAAIFSKNHTRWLVEEAIEISMILFKKTGEEMYANDVLRWMTISTAYDINKTTNDYLRGQKNNVPEKVLKRGSALRGEINNCSEILRKTAVDSKANKELLNTLSNKLLSAQQAYDMYKQEINQHYPAYFEDQYQHSLMTVSLLRRNLLLGQTFVQFYLAESKIYRLVINSQSVYIDAIEKKQDILNSVRVFKQSITDFPLNIGRSEVEMNATVRKYNQTGFQLYRKLFSDIESKLTHRLIIVPDGNLAQLPFSALLVKAAPSDLTWGQDWLVKRCAISYVYSATQLIGKQRFSLSPSNMLILSPGYESGSPKFLPHVQSEANRLTSMWSAKHLFGAQSCSHLFNQQLDAYDWVHFCGHAQADGDNMDNSFLEMGPCSPGIYSKLRISDLYTLRCKADLVTLSACNTGIGMYRTGEGTISMAHGFSFMGVRSLLISIWEVNDGSSSYIVDHFYRKFHETNKKDYALQRSQLNWVRTHAGYKSHPFYWSAFQIYGRADGIWVRNGSKVIFSLVAVLSLLGLSLWFFRKLF